MHRGLPAGDLELGVFVRLNAVQDLLELAELGDALLLLLRLTCFLVRIVKGVVLLSVPLVLVLSFVPVYAK